MYFYEYKLFEYFNDQGSLILHDKKRIFQIYLKLKQDQL